MAEFYGRLAGSGNVVTRTGSKASGMYASVEGTQRLTGEMTLMRRPSGGDRLVATVKHGGTAHDIRIWERDGDGVLVADIDSGLIAAIPAHALARALMARHYSEDVVGLLLGYPVLEKLLAAKIFARGAVPTP